MIRKIILILFLWGSVFSLYSETPTGAEEYLKQAEDFFTRGNELLLLQPEKAKSLYAKSVVYYEKLVRDLGIKNGKLYYNIGNTYFRMGNLGQAVLNYLRALEYNPGDVNLKNNLEFARSKRLDRIEEKEEKRLAKTIFFWHYEISTSVRVIIFIIFFILLMSMAITKLFTHHSLLNFFMVLSLVISLLFLGSLIVEEAENDRLDQGVILAEETIARKGNGVNYEKSFVEPLHSGLEFLLIESRRGWYNIELADGRNCWIDADDAGLVGDM